MYAFLHSLTRDSFFDFVTGYRPWLLQLLIFYLAFVAAACSTSSNAEMRPFFQQEKETQAHGRKTLLDRVVETDPGGFKVKVSREFQKQPPARIAVLPFADTGSANFVVDKIAFTHRNQSEQFDWAWTDSQRLRRAMQGYLAQREFVVMPLAAVDAVIKARGICTPKQLQQVSPEELGRLLGVDAVVYGTVLHYEAYYFLLVASWQVEVDVKVISTHDGDNLVQADGSRYATQVLPALTPIDVLINSSENFLQLRGIVLARAEEETCREIVHRIPYSPGLDQQLKQEALMRAELISAGSDAPVQTSIYPRSMR